MVIDEIKNIKSGTKELKNFGLTMAIVLGLIGLFLWWQARPSAIYFLATAVLFFGPALCCPKILWPFQKIWMSLAVILGWLMSRVILIVLFYLVTTPIGLILKISGKDLLDLKIEKNKNSYWVSRKAASKAKESYRKQF